MCAISSCFHPHTHVNESPFGDRLLILTANKTFSSGLCHPAGVCASPCGRPVHQSWPATVTRGRIFCGATDFLQTTSCASHPSPTPALKPGDVEVRPTTQTDTLKTLRHTHSETQTETLTETDSHWLITPEDLINSWLWFDLLSVPQASCRDCELEVASSAKDTLDTFCRSDFGELCCMDCFLFVFLLPSHLAVYQQMVNLAIMNS